MKSILVFLDFSTAASKALDQAIALAKTKDASIILTHIAEDEEKAKEVADRFSVGYAQQTLDFMKKNHVDLVAIMGEVSETNRHFGKMDKESVILNPYGIATLLA